MNPPVVSVICLCYNHVKYVREAIESVLTQTYPNVQLIVIDDASKDGSVEVIRNALIERPEIIFVALEKNLGNCRAFNRGLVLATGNFVIDLAADDILFPNRIDEGLLAFSEKGERYGVHYADAELISDTGQHKGLHSERFDHEVMPQGDIYAETIGRFFINSPTMMIRMEVMNQLHGYDETLAYEDFDFWIRSSRTWLYCYSARPLVKRRIVGTSMSRQQYKRNSPQLRSTYLICIKIKELNRNQKENKALLKRIRYETRKCLAVGEFQLAWNYFKLYLRVVPAAF